MLNELSVKNLGTVAQAELTFPAGFTVITGETGTGKSMLLTGLRLITGARADTGAIRHGEVRADVDSVWTGLNDDAKSSLEDLGATLSNSELFINRFVDTSGKSRLTVGGKNVPTSAAAPIAECILEIHGQSDQLRLKDQVRQREIVDSFGAVNIAPLKSEYDAAYKTWKAAEARLKDLEKNQSTRDFELQYKTDLYKRYTDLAPEPGELEKIQAEIEKLFHMEEITNAMREVMGVLNPDEGESPVSALSDIVGTLFKLSKFDEEIGRISDSFDEAVRMIEPALVDLENYAENLDLDALQTLHELEDRLHELKTFSKPFGGDLDRAIAEALAAEAYIEEFSVEIDIDALREELDEMYETAKAKANSLYEERKLVASKMSDLINVELLGLAMKGTDVVIEVSLRDTLLPTGIDDIQFLATTHGKVKRPIAKSASGGELSRIMLALEIVASSSAEPKTLVFDEVDSGVGGATAIEIGKRLALLSKRHQVIVVSHLPQVAAFGDKQYAVEKTVMGDTTETSVNEVAGDLRVREIARMLSGLDSTETGLAHAQDLLETARNIKDAF